MKLHEAEKYTSDYGDGYRRAVPGGWLYIETQNVGTGHAPVFVPDPTAEHVASEVSASIVTAVSAAQTGYAKAAADCWDLVIPVLRANNVPHGERLTLLDAFKSLRLRGSTPPAGEG